jgi:tRNA(fMet)-specific endonuclease VapC
VVTQRGLLDTSAVLVLSDHLDDPRMPERLFISAITMAELSVGPLVARTETERADRISVLQYAEAQLDPLPFDASSARAFGRVSADLRGAGRKPAARAFDALIAASALAHDLTVVTANPRDFEGIRGLAVVDLTVT